MWGQTGGEPEGLGDPVSPVPTGVLGGPWPGTLEVLRPPSPGSVPGELEKGKDPGEDGGGGAPPASGLGSRRQEGLATAAGNPQAQHLHVLREGWQGREEGWGSLAPMCARGLGVSVLECAGVSGCASRPWHRGAL